jgi:hypothetical protein
MFNQPGAQVVAETVERSFDWGSAAVGAGTGAAITLLLLALAITLRSARRTGSNHRGGRRRS